MTRGHGSSVQVSCWEIRLPPAIFPYCVRVMSIIAFAVDLMFAQFFLVRRVISRLMVSFNFCMNSLKLKLLFPFKCDEVKYDK